MKHNRLIVATFLLLVSATCLMAAGTAKKPLAWLGMGYNWIENSAGRRFMLVEKVTPEGPAARAGVTPGDVVTHVDGQAVDFGDDLEFLLFMTEKKPGQKLALTVVRSGKQLKPVLTLGTLPETSRAAWDRNLAMARAERLKRESARQKN